LTSLSYSKPELDPGVYIPGKKQYTILLVVILLVGWKLTAG